MERPYLLRPFGHGSSLTRSHGMAWVEKHGSGFRVRYRLPDGTLRSVTGFADRSMAVDRARDIESDQRRGTFVDPSVGAVPLGEWVPIWADAHDVSATTWAKYNSHLRNHVLPRFGDVPLKDISRITVKGWVKTLRRSLAKRTVGDVVTLLSMLLGDAVDEGLIGANPCRRLRVNTGNHDERPHASSWQVRARPPRCVRPWIAWWSSRRLSEAVAAEVEGRTSSGGSGCLSSTAIRPEGGHRSTLVCTSTTYVTRTRPGSSRTACRRSSSASGSDAGWPGCRAPTRM
ncbi:hypothetical protein ACQPYE_27030 [Actinosynnema sp. CA-299493]